MSKRNRQVLFTFSSLTYDPSGMGPSLEMWSFPHFFCGDDPFAMHRVEADMGTLYIDSGQLSKNTQVQVGRSPSLILIRVKVE